TIVFIIAMFLGSITFAALGTLLASPTTDNPSNIMMLSSLVRLPLIFISGIFIPLGELSGWLFVLSSLSPLTYLVDLLNSAFGNSAVYPAWLDIFVILAVIFAFVFLTKIIQKRNLVKGV
ncbi:MAG: ABC transporter permease, partial [Methanomicrobium sp.]|nr:ABC transporter permease [Methanomicrobium sp.]